MSDMSRRSFLGQSTVAAAAVASTAALATLATHDDHASPSPSDDLAPVTGALPADVGSDEPIVLHIANAAAGEIDAYVGDRRVTFTDRALVARVMQRKV
jgi:hypothetical protein